MVAGPQTANDAQPACTICSVATPSWHTIHPSRNTVRPTTTCDREAWQRILAKSRCKCISWTEGNGAILVATYHDTPLIATWHGAPVVWRGWATQRPVVLDGAIRAKQRAEAQLAQE